jgi:hypothetical protein
MLPPDGALSGPSTVEVPSGSHTLNQLKRESAASIRARRAVLLCVGAVALSTPGVAGAASVAYVDDGEVDAWRRTQAWWRRLRNRGSADALTRRAREVIRCTLTKGSSAADTLPAAAGARQRGGSQHGVPTPRSHPGLRL